jgi:hypothetical protein
MINSKFGVRKTSNHEQTNKQHVKVPLQTGGKRFNVTFGGHGFPKTILE